MLCAQQIHVVETIIKREMALLIKFLKMVMYCFQHLVIDVYIYRECVLCVGIILLYTWVITLNICMFQFQIFIVLSKNLDFNSDQSSNLNVFISILYDIVRMQDFACLLLTVHVWVFFFSNICLNIVTVVINKTIMKHNMHYTAFHKYKFHNM